MLYDGFFQYNGIQTVDAIFDSEESADQLLERLAEQHPEEKPRLQAAVQYRDGKKVKEGNDVLTEQQGLGDFATDGGTTIPSDAAIDEVVEERDSEFYADRLHDVYVAMDYHSDDPEKQEELEQRRQEILRQDPMQNLATFM